MLLKLSLVWLETLVSMSKFVTLHFISINKFIGIVTKCIFLTVKRQGFSVFLVVICVKDNNSTKGFV